MLEGRSVRTPSRPVLWLELMEADVDATERPRSREGELLPLKGKRPVAGDSGRRWPESGASVLVLD